MTAHSVVQRAARLGHGRGAPWVRRAWTALIASLAVVGGRGLGKLLVGENIIPVTLFGWMFYLGTIVMNPLLGLLLWISTAPYARFFYLDLVSGQKGIPDGIPDLTLTRMCALGLVALLTAQVATGQRRLVRFNLLDWAMIAFLVATLPSLPLHYRGMTKAVVLMTEGWVIPILIYFFAKNLVRTRAQRRLFVAVLVFIALHLAVIALHESLTGDIWFYPGDRLATYSRSLHRLIGLLGSASTFGTTFAMLFPFVAWAAFEVKNSALKLILFVIMNAVALSIFFTYNRASYLGFAWALLVLLPLYPRARRYLLPIVLVGVVIVALQWNSLQSSAVVAERIKAQGPVEYRAEVLHKVWPLIFKSPILGRGFDNFSYIYEREALGHLELSPVYYFPHNTFIYVWFSSGLLALIPFVGIHLLVVWNCWQLYRHPRPDRGVEKGLAACMLAAWGAYLMQSLVTDTIFAYYVTMTFFFLAGGVLGARSQRRLSDEESRLITESALGW
ncbi:MAG: O-antigen ligase family protein [Ardenticatenaceae bacterium]|nr:O-antigen ligase family protein [Ardenticatenaceae bacterium]